MKSEGEGGEEEKEDAPLTTEKKIISNEEEEENGITEGYISIPTIKMSTSYPMFTSF